MKLAIGLLATALIAAFSSASTFAQTSDHSSHHMNQMDHSIMDKPDMPHDQMDHAAIMNARAEHMVEVTGVVQKIYKKEGQISLSHGAIPAISWPPMTMKFPVNDIVDLDGLKKGQTVQFTLHRAADGSLPLVELCPTETADVIAGLCAPGMNHGPESKQMEGTPMDPNQMTHGDMNHHGMKP